MTDYGVTVAHTVHRRRRRWPAALALGAAFVPAAAGIALLVRTLEFRHEAMPGVRVFGQDLGGLGGKRLEQRITEIGNAQLARPMTLLVGSKTVTIRPARVVKINAEATAKAVLAAGQPSFLRRSGELLWPFSARHDVAPVLQLRRVSATPFLEQLAAFGKQPVNARIALHGTRPVVTPARAGTAPLGNRLLTAIEQQVLSGGRTVRVFFHAQPAEISTRAARAAADEAARILSAPVTLAVHGKRVGSVSAEQLAPRVHFTATGESYAVSLERDGLAALLEPAVKGFETKPKDASFVVSGRHVSIKPSVPGWKLDPTKSAAAVVTAARRTAGRTAPLALAPVQPELTTLKARALGIRQPLVSYTTQMGASSSNRIHNVHLMADFIDGTLIKPGETFSFNKVVGPRTAARGFLEGQQIVGSLTLPAIGGGVCQTATTLFNDAFETGLPIVSRVNHNYYLAHYPLGRDATVNWGGPDLVFKNDLDHGLLITTSYTDQTLTFTFYGTPQGRQVKAETGPQVNWTNPKPSYAYDAYGSVAPPGKVVRVAGTGEKGFDVTVFRKVYEHGTLIRDDSFFSRYVPVGDTLVYGKGLKPPGPYVWLPAPE